MTYEFEYLMHLFACGARGMTPQPPHQIVDFDRLIQLAQNQSVFPLVGVALSKAPDIGFPREKVQVLVKSTRGLALANYIRKMQILRLLQDFEKAGLQAVLLKGYAVADMYAEPDCRISCDIDIYISIKDEKRACQLLIDHGCKVYPRSPTSHHTVCEHPKMGVIELHVILYDELVEDIWFGKITDQQLIKDTYIKHKTEEDSFLILGETDNLLFLALHMIKHFILSGASLRQMMDIALYLKTHQEKIDFERFWDTMGSLKYRILMNTVLSVMVLYCGFLPEDFKGLEIADNDAVSALLDDLEEGGWQDKNEEEERKAVWHVYNRIKFTEKRSSISYWGYMVVRSAISLLSSIFLRRSLLIKKYAYAGKNSWLIPVAWIHHLLFGLVKLFCGKLDTEITVHINQLSADKNNRIHLFKLMQII